MKKALIISIFVITFALVLICFLFALSNNVFYQEYKYFMPKNTVEKKLYDDHGGFAIDGVSLYSYSFDKDGANNFIAHIKGSQDWYSTPLPDDLNTVLYGKDNYNYKYGIKAGLPKIKNGYWRYKSYRAGNYLDCNFFSLSIYDLDSNTLYLLKVKI